MTVGVLILAAGQSLRMGTDKRQLPWGDSNLIEQSLDSCRRSGLDFLVALSERDSGHPIAIKLGSTSIAIKNADLGLGHTLANSIDRLPESWEALIVHLADMPLVKSTTLTQIASELQQHSIVIPKHQQKRGNPRGFARGLWPKLKELKGDQGAKPVIMQHPEMVYELDVDDPGILIDIDTQEDYKIWRG